MQRVWYGGAEFITDNEVADALMGYASVLAVLSASDVVRIPGVDSGGTVRTFQLVVGPASQILAVATDEATVAMDVDDIVRDLRRRSSAKLPSTMDVLAATQGFDLPHGDD